MFFRKCNLFRSLAIFTIFSLLLQGFSLPALAASGEGSRAVNIQLGEEIRRTTLPVIDDEPPLLSLRALANACGLSLNWDAKTNLAVISIGDLAIVYHPLLKIFYCLERTYPVIETETASQGPWLGIPLSRNLLLDEDSAWQQAAAPQQAVLGAPVISFSKVVWPEPPLLKSGVTYVSLPFLPWLGMTAFWDEDFRCLDLLLAADLYQNPVKALTLEEVLPLIREDFELELAAAKAAQPELLATYSTKFNPGEKNRTINLKLAAAAINDTEIKPGSIFSFNTVVGPRSSANGYQKAIVFVGGAKELDYGGGVCQVSSTLYNAVLEAKLPVIERHPHGQPVTYVPKGKDATVAFGILDFRFRNDLKETVKITAKTEENSITIELWKTK
ncbi:MAG: VanW family protein [Clostridiales bacterium]|jgi:hypothetical protein|nr:VanW family protein [Clostridiales bacterium]